MVTKAAPHRLADADFHNAFDAGSLVAAQVRKATATAATVARQSFVIAWRNSCMTLVCHGESPRSLSQRQSKSSGLDQTHTPMAECGIEFVLKKL